ncbi:MAG: PLP-dependent aminotransferase family protein [Spirochaetes bacterium]|nr:PLP-dependent aminotransferase family protein [Spirochaetota bacterium]
MGFNYDEFFSSVSKIMKKSVIRELLKLTEKPEIISFAGGLPAPETFPVNDLIPIINKLIEREGAKILQYGATEGYGELRKLLTERISKQMKMPLTVNNLLVVSASQQALDIVGKIFIDPGDKIITERPSYLGGLSAFNSYKANIIGVTLEDDGICIKELEETLDTLYNKRAERIKFFYTIPDFQNPAGVTTSLEKRKKIVELANKYDFLIIEDLPYRELRYEGVTLPTLYELDGGKRVISLYTFSKIFCPGLRLGWIVAPEEVINKVIIAKQAMDLCTPPFNQAIAAAYIKEGLLEERIRKNIEIYSKKRKFMLEILDKYLGGIEEVKWTKPEGGLFLWMTLPDYIDCDELFYKAIENNVAYVIGSAFYPEYPEKNHFRMNFSYPSFDQIEEGVKRLSKVIKDSIK